MSAPFRQLIGPAKSRLQRYTTEVDDLLLDNRPEDEDQHLFLRDARLLKTRLVNVIALLSEQNNRWQQYIAGLPTAEKAAANQEYSDFDTGEDAFTIVLDHGREALDTLQAAIDDEISQTGTEQLLQNLTGTAPDWLINNHTAVWGSYWRDDKWGYACCHEFVKNSYCLGEEGIKRRRQEDLMMPREMKPAISGMLAISISLYY